MTYNLENGTVLDPEKALKDKAFKRYCDLEAKAIEEVSSMTEKEERELNRLRQLMVREFQDYFDE